MEFIFSIVDFFASLVIFVFSIVMTIIITLVCIFAILHFILMIIYRDQEINLVKIVKGILNGDGFPPIQDRCVDDCDEINYDYEDDTDCEDDFDQQLEDL